MTVLAQTALPGAPPEIAWAAISPELTLFGVGILVLLLDTAGEHRLRASVAVLAVTLAGAGLAAVATGAWALPALAALAGVAQLALTARWSRRPRLLGAVLACTGFVATIGLTAWQQATAPAQTVVAGMVAADGVAHFTRYTVAVAGLLTVGIGFGYLEERRIHRGEYYPLLLLAATGMTLLGASADLIMVFMAIEILSLSLYILTGFPKRDLNAQEAALKYFLLGAFSSALLLYGVALVYGITGSTNLADAGAALTVVGAPVGLSVAALSLLIVGFGFKTAVVPFHMWTPDVYQGAPTPVTGFMSAATKAAAFAAFLRVFSGAFGPLALTWRPALYTLAVLTMMAGAILAVVQTDLKRMLGYSAIAHAGYVLIGLMSVSRDGVGATLFYLLVYAIMSVGSFGVLTALEGRSHKAVALDDVRGFGRRSPLVAGMMGLFLFGLAGLPGTAGFMAKFAVFRAGVEADLTWLVVVAVVSSVIAAFFYVRVIVAMFMDDEPAEAAAQPPLVPRGANAAGLAVASAAVIVLGVVPGALVDLAARAATLAL
ncbi:NADH-quinone oxidoreductase subunit N [soil metagenome]